MAAATPVEVPRRHRRLADYLPAARARLPVPAIDGVRRADASAAPLAQQRRCPAYVLVVDEDPAGLDAVRHEAHELLPEALDNALGELATGQVGVEPQPV